MGNDGGILTKGRKHVKTVKVGGGGPKSSSVGGRGARLTTCALTAEPLAPPIVADELGHLFNKDALIAYLLDRSRSIPAFSHVRRLKDVVEVRVTPISAGAGAGAGSSASSASASSDSHVALFMCPLTQEAANGAAPFVVARGCGCMLSERAARELLRDGGGGASAACPACAAPLQPPAAKGAALSAPPPPLFIKLCPTELEEADTTAGARRAHVGSAGRRAQCRAEQWRCCRDEQWRGRRCRCSQQQRRHGRGQQALSRGGGQRQRQRRAAQQQQRLGARRGGTGIGRRAHVACNERQCRGGCGARGAAREKCCL